MQRQFSVLACTLIAVLAFAAPAAAEQCGATKDQYGDQVQRLKPCDPGDPGDPGGLPFTGLDLGMMSAAAVMIAGAGVVIRRRTDAEER